MNLLSLICSDFFLEENSNLYFYSIQRSVCSNYMRSHIRLEFFDKI